MRIAIHDCKVKNGRTSSQVLHDDRVCSHPVGGQCQNNCDCNQQTFGHISNDNSNHEGKVGRPIPVRHSKRRVSTLATLQTECSRIVLCNSIVTVFFIVGVHAKGQTDGIGVCVCVCL